MDYVHVIKVTYLGPTNTLGARIKLTSGRFEDSITLARDYQKYPVDQAVAWLADHGYEDIRSGELGPISIVTTSTFKPLKEGA